MFERFTREVRQVVTDSVEIAGGAGAAKVAPEHLLLALADGGQGGGEQSGARVLTGHGVTAAALRAALAPRVGRAGLTDDEVAALRVVGVDIDEVFRRIEEAFGPDALSDLAAAPPPRRRGRLGAPFTPEAKKVLELSLREAVALRQREITSGHLLLALLRQGLPGPIAEVLTAHGVTYDGVRRQIPSI
ncbi:Clp protease N-terminal domain-containing protein [Micromonospora sp. NPDC049559]|uniref:Clp protease N-terminal domain-containing protein n=1 Tax=Micromonospora sp. NPDC049559 TaxID=3155923 RepID=UPI0034351FE9